MILCIGTTPAAQRVMVFGKLELDCVNRAHQTCDGIAGKSINVAKVLTTLGSRAIAAGFLGGDSGAAILKQLRARGITTHFISVAPATRQCLTVIDESGQTVTELVEESRPVAPENYESLETIVQGLLPGCQAVVMSGSLTPGGPVDFYRKITNLANSHRIQSIVDAQGPPLVQALEAGPGLVKPNRQELGATVGHALGTESEVITAMKEVQRRGAARVVVTAGKSPALALDGEDLWRIHPPQVKAVNAIGSGDAFTAGLVWRLLQGESLGQSCRWAAASGAANALNVMPGEVDPKEIERLAAEVVVEKL
ncbi:MAG TPA: hexose kinase [Verrucomicrobiae bacterium]|nr:hexose kinase [Verrucomicrobiae bacterium]